MWTEQEERKSSDPQGDGTHDMGNTPDNGRYKATALYRSTGRYKATARYETIGHWLISALEWGPLFTWVAWPLLDDGLDWHPAVGYVAMVALALNWVHNGLRGVHHKRWPALLAVLAAFSVSFSVALQSADVGRFMAVSIVAGALVEALASALIVVLAVFAARVPDYGRLEDALVFGIPLVIAAIVAGITAGAIEASTGKLLLGLGAGLGAGMIPSIFCLAWVYGTVGIVSAWVEKIGGGDQHKALEGRYWHEGDAG
jgi:hypothetical protein